MIEETVFAWTQYGSNLPSFVHVGLNPLCEYEVSTRSTGSAHICTAVLSRAELETLTRRLAEHLGLKVS